MFIFLSFLYRQWFFGNIVKIIIAMSNFVKEIMHPKNEELKRVLKIMWDFYCIVSFS